MNSSIKYLEVLFPQSFASNETGYSALILGVKEKHQILRKKPRSLLLKDILNFVPEIIKDTYTASYKLSLSANNVNAANFIFQKNKFDNDTQKLIDDFKKLVFDKNFLLPVQVNVESKKLLDLLKGNIAPANSLLDLRNTVLECSISISQLVKQKQKFGNVKRIKILTSAHFEQFFSINRVQDIKIKSFSVYENFLVDHMLPSLIILGSQNDYCIMAFKYLYELYQSNLLYLGSNDVIKFVLKNIFFIEPHIDLRVYKGNIVNTDYQYKENRLEVFDGGNIYGTFRALEKRFNEDLQDKFTVIETFFLIEKAFELFEKLESKRKSDIVTKITDLGRSFLLSRNDSKEGNVYHAIGEWKELYQMNVEFYKQFLVNEISSDE